MMKVGLIGAGAVASACLLSMVTRGVAREIVVVNRDRRRAEGLVADMQYGATLSETVQLSAGDYSGLAGAELVILTVGLNEKSGGATDRSDPAGRLRLLDANAKIYREVVPQLTAAAPDAVLLVVTDPPDPLAALARELAGHDRVLSSGTFLDSQRLRFHIARHLGVTPSSVEAQVLGEHGTSQVFVWSGVRVGGTLLATMLGADGEACAAFQRKIEEEVRFANISIIEGTSASQLGIGVVTARIVQAVLRDERIVLPIGSHQAHYGTTLSLPSIVGREGVLRELEPSLSAAEQEAVQRSATTIADAFGGLAP